MLDNTLILCASEFSCGADHSVADLPILLAGKAGGRLRTGREVNFNTKATADPLLFDDAKITGAYIIDPWYPRVSTIWGPSDPAGTFQDEAEMRRNFLPWKRPEGRYPDRDGLWLIVAPTVPASEMG